MEEIEMRRTDMNKCYECKYRATITGDAHTQCLNKNAHVEGDIDGRRGGWFMWPLNFDPVWLISCDGFSKKDKTGRGK